MQGINFSHPFVLQKRFLNSFFRLLRCITEDFITYPADNMFEVLRHVYLDEVSHPLELVSSIVSAILFVESADFLVLDNVVAADC